MKKCDVIIPVYNAPDYTKMCVYTLFKNTDMNILNKVYLLNDNSNEVTRNLLENLVKKYPEKIVLINNSENVGFIKNVNNGMAMCKSDYVLLLNTDCFIGHHTIEKLMNHIEKDKKIGLICPLCSNAANLTLPMFPGFSYMMMDELLEKKFFGKSFDACTVVGNCLMITKECIKKVGYFDEIYGMGYGDETDYQFQAMAKGFKAKVALDSYVFHKAEMSFNTTNKTRSERLEENRKIFFDRWKKEYYALLKEYEKNNPIQYVNSKLNEKDKNAEFDFVFVMNGIGNGIGGASMIINIVNYLSILGMKVGLLNLCGDNNYKGIMNFEILTTKDIKKLKSKYLISTIFNSMFFTRKLADKIGSKVVYFSQGYEFLFENGRFYGEVESSFKLADHVITISDYLKDRYKKIFGIDAIKIENGIDIDQLIGKRIKHEKKSITMLLRPEALKGGCFMQDILKYITLNFNDLDIHLVNNDRNNSLCINNNPTITIHEYEGPITSNQIAELLKKTDILVDTSLSEGFGLLPLEAMAAGAVPIVANAFGNATYCKNQINSIVIDDVNNTYSYIEALDSLLSDAKKLEKFSKQAIKTAESFDFDKTIEKYYQVLNDILENKVSKIEQKISLQEMDKLSNYIYSNEQFRYQIRVYQTSNSADCINRRQTRLDRFYIIFKEFIKTNFFLFKLFIKTVLKKDFRI